MVTFGVRKITYSLAGSDNLALSVNGVPVMAKGGDWGIDEAMKRIPRKRLEAQVRMHQLANYTMIRNWVGQSTSEELYDFCDQYGILLWDEFFEPHPADGPIPEDVPLYLANVRDKILRFRSHPCIALWCARNEGDPPPAIGKGIQSSDQRTGPGPSLPAQFDLRPWRQLRRPLPLAHAARVLHLGRGLQDRGRLDLRPHPRGDPRHDALQ